MKAITRISIVFIALASIPFFSSWGTFGHEHINRAAVLALPDSMRSFFFNHIDYVTQESTVPDLRKYTMQDKTEIPKHFIDLEKFGAMDSIPKDYIGATKKYKKDFFQTIILFNNTILVE